MSTTIDLDKRELDLFKEIESGMDTDHSYDTETKTMV